ncbi:MAG: Gfo/Idh/MocA family oxidoreductase, partial [Nitrospinaceae bacterium]|nr:Gfo/Idh/MocA family oxidoreductase [Nitrospinaceae bacterium]
KIKQGAVGKLRFITCHLEQSWFAQASGPGRGWKTDPNKAGGGQLVDSGSHTIAAMLDVSGLTPTEVYASVQNWGLAVDVNTAMVVRFAEGAQAAVTIGGFGHRVTESIRLIGDSASMSILYRTIKEQRLEVDGELASADLDITPSNPSANFVDTVLGKNSPRADVGLGLKVAQVCQAAYLSAERNRPVTISEVC